MRQVLEDQALWRDKTKGLNNLVMDGSARKDDTQCWRRSILAYTSHSKLLEL